MFTLERMGTHTDVRQSKPANVDLLRACRSLRPANPQKRFWLYIENNQTHLWT